MRTQRLPNPDHQLLVARRGPKLNARFTGNKRLEAVARGRSKVGIGSKGAHVQKIEQALVDTGFALPFKGVNKHYGKETAAAVKRFQREAGLGQTGTIDKKTLMALSRVSPPPGETLVRSFDYDRLFADGRLDVTIAVGYDEDGAHIDEAEEARQMFSRMGFSVVTASDKPKLGIDALRDDPNAELYTKKVDDPTAAGKRADVVVRLIAPQGDRSAVARDSFEQALQQDEVVIYNGHARYGTGPDFDHMTSGAGNFVIDPKGNPKKDRPPKKLRDALRGRDTDLPSLKQKPDYQALVLNACTTENYLKNLRDPKKFNGRDTDNTDIVASTIPTWVATGSQHTEGFLKGILSGKNLNEMLEQENTVEVMQSEAWGEPSTRAKNTYIDNGTIDNASNSNEPRSP